MSYRTKSHKITEKTYREIEQTARGIYNNIVRRSKRNPYVRSRYFAGNKVFLRLFWEHLNQKHRYERRRRLKFYPCAIELLEKTVCKPTVMQNPNRKNEFLYRFSGTTPDGEQFYVQVKEDCRSNRKFFMSVFPAK